MKNAEFWSGRTIRETFDQHYLVDPTSGCHVWQRSRSSGGYGQLNVGGRPMLAHRFAWSRVNGAVPEGMFLLHNCDNPVCVRVDHLRLGTIAENVAEMCAKGRRNNAGGWRSRTKGPPRKLVRDNFGAHYQIDSATGCWNWQLALNRDGYGKVVGLDGKKTGAHRFSWEIANKQRIPDAMVVRHKCDNPTCVNPDHLVLGTQADNVADTVKRGRQSSGRGERGGNAKMSWQKVDEIRARLLNGESRSALALRYGLTYQQVRNIQNERCWRPEHRAA